MADRAGPAFGGPIALAPGDRWGWPDGVTYIIEDNLAGAVRFRVTTALQTDVRTDLASYLARTGAVRMAPAVPLFAARRLAALDVFVAQVEAAGLDHAPQCRPGACICFLTEIEALIGARKST